MTSIEEHKKFVTKPTMFIVYNDSFNAFLILFFLLVVVEKKTV